MLHLKHLKILKCLLECILEVYFRGLNHGKTAVIANEQEIPLHNSRRPRHGRITTDSDTQKMSHQCLESFNFSTSLHYSCAFNATL
jgi:hypothetical protein